MQESRDQNFFFARQPILNRDRVIIAYELLYRDNAYSVTSAPMPPYATEQVLVNALNIAGLSNCLEQDTKAFINLNEKILFSDILTNIPKQHFVFELLEHIQYTPEIIERIRDLHDQGYTFALDDVVCSDAIMQNLEPILPYVGVVKLDLSLQNVQGIKPYIDHFKTLGVTVLAEKVESRDDYLAFKEMGCDLFQGYFFARPTLVSGKKIDPRIIHIFHIIELLNQMRHDEALEVFEQDASLTLQLIRYINSAAFSFKSRIKSVRQATALLGTLHLKQWLTMMGYTLQSKEGLHSPLLKLAQERANIMRLLAQYVPDKVSTEDAAFIGLISLVDALFDKPLESVLHDLHIDHVIIDVLTLQHQGMMATIYALALSVESGDETMHEHLTTMGLDYKTFGHIVALGYERTETFNQAMQEHSTLPEHDLP